MAYRAKQSLIMGSRVIKAGKLVPDHYPRMREAIERGWVEEIDPSPSLSSPEVPADIPNSPAAEELVISPDPEAPITIPADPSHDLQFDPEPDKSEEPKKGEEIEDISTLDFLNESTVQLLRDAGIHKVSDLGAWTFEQLTDIKGIGTSRANRLLDAYQEYRNKKDGE